MKVKNMTSDRGNKIANQFVVRHEGARFFQSYDSVIAMIKEGQTYLDTYYWDYSVTTGKYRNLFLGEKIAETRKKIKTGEYILTDLQDRL